MNGICIESQATGQKPLVSIVTPVINLVRKHREAHFKQMVDSVCAQDYGRSNIEHIVVDGGSRDGTRELVTKYHRMGRIDRWVSEPDTGLYSAINKGVSLSRGTILNTASSDDYFTEDAVRLSVAAFIDHNAEYTHGLTPYLLPSGETWYVAGKPYSWNQIYFGMPIGHQSLFVRRTCFDHYGPYSEKHRVLSDYLFALRLHLARAKRVSLDRVTCYFRHFDGESSSDDRMFREFEDQYEQTSASLNLSREQFLLFAYYANRFMGENIIKRPPDPCLLNPALQRLEDCPDRLLALDFQKSLVFCLFHTGACGTDRTAARHIEGDWKITDLVDQLRKEKVVSQKEVLILSRFPFLEHSEQQLIELDRLLTRLNALPESRLTFRLQQLWIRGMYKLIYS